ncbi:hypothetical protein IFT59_07580 [Rhizobium sp. CFBP 8752]|uniref:hypothetical protein n=1 Tax=Rhizobium sp. CFBP 8752 TaxID=2775301 RepID=UPI00177D2B20|nr:hypothetical protein [Rhizobium sp. CFBP 8752]MBD8663112.1 hypothetical protein [Rhizobium sp. CFBP 8752]
MFAQINLYLMIGLAIICLLLGGGWYWQSGRDAATIDTLKGNNTKLALSVELNERTIQQMVKDTQVLAAANKTLTTRIVTTEMEFVDEWAAINALDLESDEAVADVTGLEATVNSNFANSVNELRSATSR